MACIRQQDGELVATEPCKNRFLPEPGRQANGQGLEHSIARAVPPTVVHLLEAVEVQHEDADSVSSRQPRIERLFEAGAVRQTGQKVMMGQLDQPRVARPPFGDVAQDRAKAEAGPVPPHREGELGGKLAAIAAASGDLDCSTGQTGGLVTDHPRHARLVTGTESLGNDQIDVRALQLVDAVAEQDRSRLVRKRNAAPVVAGDEGISGGPSETVGTRDSRFEAIQLTFVGLTMCRHIHHSISASDSICTRRKAPLCTILQKIC
jgi:hypothetical protein